MRWRSYFSNNIIALLGLALIPLSSCAGPMSPLGAVWAITPGVEGISENTNFSDFNEGFQTQSPYLKPTHASVSFIPSRQVLHGSAPFVITVFDPEGIDGGQQVRVFHNDVEVSTAFHLQAQSTVSPNRKSIAFRINSLRLQPAASNAIEVSYQKTPFHRTVMANHMAPECQLTDQRVIRSTANYSPPTWLLKIIEKRSFDEDYNPNFIAALIAQESSFRPRAVSWAGGIGLAQITSLAEGEILKDDLDWPRYPNINRFNLPMLKALIFSGKVNSKNEWRLNPETAIDGALIYLNYLNEYWQKNDLMASDKLEKGRIILASYNSGPARVKSAIMRYHSNWLDSPKLKAAKNYVKKIESLCHHFSQPPLHWPRRA